MSEMSLLPATSTNLAKALDLLESRLLDLPVEMITKDPGRVDAGLLDYLAWEMSVDVWAMDWPESVKRQVIGISAEVHRYKGTPYAIRTALEAFDVDTELLEWHAPDGIADGMARGSFRVTAYAGRSLYGDTENSIDTRMLEAMNAVVQRVAPVSRNLDFRLGERFSGSAAIRNAARPCFHHDALVDPDPRPHEAIHEIWSRQGLGQRGLSAVDHDVRIRPTTSGVGLATRLGLRAVAIDLKTHDVQRRGAA